MSLRTNPASGVTYGEVFKSGPLERPVDRRPVTFEVHYFEDRLGPQVLVNCAWGRHLTTGNIGQAVVLPRQEWDQMLAAIAATGTQP